MKSGYEAEARGRCTETELCCNLFVVGDDEAGIVFAASLGVENQHRIT